MLTPFLCPPLSPQIDIPKPSNACFGFDSTTGWTFFDLNALHDEYRDEPGTVVEADFVSDPPCAYTSALFHCRKEHGNSLECRSFNRDSRPLHSDSCAPGTIGRNRQMTELVFLDLAELRS